MTCWTVSVHDERGLYAEVKVSAEAPSQQTMDLVKGAAAEAFVTIEKVLRPQMRAQEVTADAEPPIVG